MKFYKTICTLEIRNNNTWSGVIPSSHLGISTRPALNRCRESIRHLIHRIPKLIALPGFGQLNWKGIWTAFYVYIYIFYSWILRCVYSICIEYRVFLYVLYISKQNETILFGDFFRISNSETAVWTIYLSDLFGKQKMCWFFHVLLGMQINSGNAIRVVAPLESPSINKSDHPGGWEKVWEYHWQMLIPTCAYCAGCCCTGGRGGATKETGRAALVVYMVGDTCTRSRRRRHISTLFQAIPLMRFTAKRIIFGKKTKN